MPPAKEKDKDKALREHLLALLNGGGAHAGFDKAIEGLPVALRGKRPKARNTRPGKSSSPAAGAVGHSRVQPDSNTVSPDWPVGIWPKTQAPPNSTAWSKSVKAFQAGLKAVCQLVEDPSTKLYARIPHGDGQTVLRFSQRPC